MTEDKKRELKAALAALDGSMARASGDRSFEAILALGSIVKLLSSAALDDHPRAGERPAVDEDLPDLTPAFPALDEYPAIRSRKRRLLNVDARPRA